MARISPSEAAAKFNRTMIGGSGSTLPKEVVQRAQANAAAALARAGYLMPYTRALLANLQMIMTEEVETLAVTPDLYLLYNPFFAGGLVEVGKMDLWELGAAFLHESLHVIYRHFTRSDEYEATVLRPSGEVLDHGRMNIANDAEINSTLVGIKPISPTMERLANVAYRDMVGNTRNAGVDKDTLMARAREQAEREFASMPAEKKYPLDDWPSGPVSLPDWFWYAHRLNPAQPPNLLGEDYYPFTVPKKGGPQPPPPPPPGPKIWRVGERVTIKGTDVEGEVVFAGPWDPETETQEVRVMMTNNTKEAPRSKEAALAAKAIMDAQRGPKGVAAMKPCGCDVRVACNHAPAAAGGRGAGVLLPGKGGPKVSEWEWPADFPEEGPLDTDEGVLSGVVTGEAAQIPVPAPVPTPAPMPTVKWW